MRQHTSRLAFSTIAASLLTAFALPASALTPGSGTWVKESATYGTPNLQNAYVYVPKSTTPEVRAGKRALMLTLHGCGMTAQGNVIDGAYNWEKTAEKYGMVVVTATVPTGTSSTRAVAGCWDWFGSNHSRTSRDSVPLKKLIDAVKARSNLDIDPNQIYITGLSAGGGMTLAMGCAFPDVFAGVGPNAAPAFGASAYDISVAPKITPQQVANYCKAANGNNYNNHFQTQIYAGVWGNKDTLVLPAHNDINAQAFALLYNTPYSNPLQRSVAGGGAVKEYGPNGAKTVYTMLVSGMGHAWPAGTDAPKKNVAYVDSTRANYPVDVTKWFFENNRRVVSLPPPANLACPNLTNNGITLSWGAVAGASAYAVSRNGNTVGTPSTTGFTDSGLSSGTNYTYSVRATANGSSGAEATITCKTTGNPPPTPVLPAPSGLSGSSTSSVVTLSWGAVANAKGYNVYRNGSLLGFTAATGYTANGLAASTSYTFAVSTVNAADVEGSAASTSVTTQASVLYSQVQTASVVSHYAAGRLTLQQYLGFGAKIGYVTNLTLYKCGSTWTNQSDCSAMQI